MTRCIFSIFEGALRLGCNVSKCQMVPIHCSLDKIELVSSLFPCQVVEFLMKYLNISLSVGKLPKSVFGSLWWIG
jgi:hypothetical protein